jgi:transposase
MIPIANLIENLSEAECKTLEEMSQHHRYSNFQLRARGLLALNAGHSPAVVAGVLRKTPQTVYNWAKWWRKDGLAGILNGNKGSRPLKLTAEMLDTAKKLYGKNH